jgi:GTP-binding protein YchF
MLNAVIIGLPQSGKTRVFVAASETHVDAFAPREPRQAMARVPEPRLDYLVKLNNPKKVTYETITFVDVPGCSLASQKGQEEWRRLLPTVRQADVLVIVVRAFENPAVPSEKIDAQAEFQEVWEELIFADLETVTRRTEKVEKALKKPSKSHDAEKQELNLLTRCREALESETPLSTVINTEDERKLVRSFAFLTQLPIVCVQNLSDGEVESTPPLEFEHIAASLNLCADIEAEIALLDPEERAGFMEEMGLAEPARDRLVRACFQAAGRICFLTMGPEEVRAWAVREGSSAVDAAGSIHTDLARGFIRAETVAYEDLVAHEDMKGAKAAGKVRKEGKSYIVQDGDIMLILANA